MDESGNAAIVTGASQGIGKSIAKCLLGRGYKVFIFDINSVVGNETVKELDDRLRDHRVTFLKCDVTNDEQFRGAFREAVRLCKNITLLVNNAGIADEHKPDNCIAVNLSAVIKGSNMAIDHMRKDQGGRGGTVINVASMSAFESYHAIPTYCATKSGVVNFTKSWAKHPKMKELGLKFMCLCPGFVKTSLTENGASKTLDPPVFEAAKQAIGLLPLETIETAFDKLLLEGTNGSVLEVSTFKTDFLTDPVFMQSKLSPKQ